MEVGIGSDAFKTDVSCTRSLLPCSGALCKPVTAGGFWAWLTHSHFFLSFPFSAHPFSFLGQHQNTVGIFKPVAESWLSHGCSKGHFGFCPPTAWKELCMDKLVCNGPIADTQEMS